LRFETMSFEAELAGVQEHGRTVALGAVDPLIELQPRAQGGEHAHEIDLAPSS
jgi:hypothetical protein